VSDTPDLTAQLLPQNTYFPHPKLVPGRLMLTGIGFKGVPMSTLRRLGACSDDGPDSVWCAVEPSSGLPTDPESPPPPAIGGLSFLRSAQVDAGGERKVAWFASVTGLTFRADDSDRVYVEGADGMVVLHDGKAWADSHGQPLRPTVWAKEEAYELDIGVSLKTMPELDAQLRQASRGAGKSKQYESYAAMVDARNTQRLRLRPTHGLVPDAIGPLLGLTPMIGGFNKTMKVEAKPLKEVQGLELRHVGTRYEVSMADAWAKQAHGEKPESPQAVLRYDAPVICTEDTIDLAAMQVLRNHDTESLLVIVGLLMNAYDTNNRTQRIGASDLARIRGVELTKSSVKRAYGEMSRTLQDVVFRVRPMSTKADAACALLPLFVHQGMVVSKTRKLLPVVTMNAVLFDTMRKRGHGILLSRRLLEVNLRDDEWAARIDMALSWQWAMGWKVNGYADGKRLRRTTHQLLADAGIKYDLDAERRKRGTPAVRMKVARTLDALVALRLSLRSWKQTRVAADLADDVYELTPTALLANALTARRQPALRAGTP